MKKNIFLYHNRQISKEQLQKQLYSALQVAVGSWKCSSIVQWNTIQYITLYTTVINLKTTGKVKLRAQVLLEPVYSMYIVHNCM